jgi:hypothetical protein
LTVYISALRERIRHLFWRNNSLNRCLFRAECGIFGSMGIAVEGPQIWGFTTEIPKEPHFYLINWLILTGLSLFAFLMTKNKLFYYFHRDDFIKYIVNKF